MRGTEHLAAAWRDTAPAAAQAGRLSNESTPHFPHSPMLCSLAAGGCRIRTASGWQRSQASWAAHAQRRRPAASDAGIVQANHQPPGQPDCNTTRPMHGASALHLRGCRGRPSRSQRAGVSQVDAQTAQLIKAHARHRPLTEISPAHLFMRARAPFCHLLGSCSLMSRPLLMRAPSDASPSFRAKVSKNGASA